MISAVWDKYPQKSYDIINCVGQVSSQTAMISAVWDNYPHKEL
jgi:hypothetical protein